MLAMEENNTNNPMTFVCQELSTTMFQKLYEQKKTNRFCDLTLQVNNKIIKAHRNVLACSSPYFDSILKHHKIIREQLIITCLNNDIFNLILNYMYTGHITIQHSNVEELLKLADHFIITKVIEYCIEFLGTKLNLNNCLFTYFLTQRFKLKHLGNIVENWIVSHIDEICNGHEIITLNPQQLFEFFKNKNFVLNTSKSLNILSQWILNDLEKRELYFERLIKCFQTNTLEPVEVFKHLETSLLYNKSELCLYRFLDYLFQNNWMLSNFKTKYDSLHIKYGQTISANLDNEFNNKILNDTNKIQVIEKNENSTLLNNFNSVIVKAKLRNRKQLILKRLMLFGLKPSLRMAAIKMLTSKKNFLLTSTTTNDDNNNHNENDVDNNNVDDDDDDENLLNDDNDINEKIGIKCPICFIIINDSLLLEQHLALSHSKDVTYKCGICSFVCQYHGDYLNHMKTHFPGPLYKCDYCETTTDQISKLISHRAQHLDESIYQCQFCSFKCRLKQNFITHLKIHTPPTNNNNTTTTTTNNNNNNKLYKCDNCTKSFRFKQNFETHQLTHNNNNNNLEKNTTNLQCELCGFHTKFLSHMIAHKRIHTGDIYRCSYPHCKYSTTKKNQLTSHTKSHNGIRPHSCTICGRGFMEKSHLVRHERIHLEEKPFKCTNCDYASSRRDKLKEHFTRHHGENASAKVPYKARPMRNNNNNNNNTSNNNSTTRSNKLQTSQETVTNNTTTTNGNNTTTTTNNNTNSNNSNNNSNVNFTHNNNPNVNGVGQPIGNDIQDLIMHHQNSNVSSASVPNLSAINSNYHHFADPTDFHHHNHPAHNIHNQLLTTNHNRNNNQHHNNNLVNHHMLTRTNHSTATSTAAAVAAAMMLDPRFHHNTTVPYHPTTTPVSMAMAAVQSSQQIQSSSQHGDYPPSLQNCMTLF